MPADGCISCGFQGLEGTVICPQCGTPVADGQKSSRNNRIVAITAFVLLFVVGFGLIVMRAVRWSYLKPPHRSRPNLSAAAASYMSKHGGILGREQLKGTGKVYLVPVGKVDAAALSDLTGYFKTKFGLDIPVLPPITAVKRHKRESSQFWFMRVLDLFRSDPYKEGQLWVEEILELLPLSHPEVVRDHGAILIGITGDDIVPRDFDWNFTFSWRSEDRFAIISSARMGMMPDGQIDLNLVVSDLRKMVMKDIGVLYYKLPLNNDPTSALYNSINLYLAGDDFYESDLHPEAMPWGRHGSTDPCLTVIYDYSNAAAEPSKEVGDCDPEAETEHPQREKFTLDLRYGLFIDRKTDFFFKDSPPILFRRVYRTREVSDRAFGWGASHSYNTFLTTQSQFPFSYVDMVFDDGGHIRFRRTSWDLWLSRWTRFEPNVAGPYHRSQLTWDGDLFHVNMSDGASYTYLPCGGATPCYLTGFRDRQGRVLEIQRDPYLNLQRLKSASSQINFTSDESKHIVRATDHQGNEVRYEHDTRGDVTAVRYPSGNVARYGYDAAHQMLTATIRSPGRTKSIQLFKNEYDSSGRIIRHKQSNGVEYKIEYRLDSRQNVFETTVTDPSGAVTRLRYGGGSDYALWRESAPSKK